MIYSPECVAAFEAKFVGVRRRAEGAGFWFDFDAGAYDGHEKYKPQIDEANSLIYAFAANWERVRELEDALHDVINIAGLSLSAARDSGADVAHQLEELAEHRKLLEKGNE